MNRFCHLLLLCLFIATGAYAQNEQVRINNIKKSLDFIYATGTSINSAKEAYSNAKELLSLEIEQWLKENTTGEHSGYVAKAVNNLSEIETKRGNLFRVFVYVKKTDILSFGRNDSILMVTTNDDSLTKTMDTLTISKSNQNSLIEPNNEHSVTPSNPPSSTALFTITSSEKEMLSIHNLSEINTYIAKGDKDGKIIAYGKYNSDTKLFSRTHFFLINKRGDVIAAMRKDGNALFNIGTGKEDSFDNYGKCGIIWFQLAE